MTKRDISITFLADMPHIIRKNYSFFDIGRNENYFDYELTRKQLDLFCNHCYIPSNDTLNNLIAEFPKDIKLNFMMGTTLLELLKEERQDVLESFNTLLSHPNVELLASTGRNTLSSLIDDQEFLTQIKEHKDMMKILFDKTPKVLCNTAMIYSNDISKVLDTQFNAVLTEGTARILGWRSPNFVYQSKVNFKQKLLMRNPYLSNSISMKFSDRSWHEYPLTADKCVDWILGQKEQSQCINIVIDYETFGYYQSLDTGILGFLYHFLKLIALNSHFALSFLSECAKKYDPIAKIDVPHPISWSGSEKDTSLWEGNELQKSSEAQLYALKSKIRKMKGAMQLNNWFRLQNAIYFEYMDTRWKDETFTPHIIKNFDTPEHAYIVYQNILNDISHRI